MLCYLIFIFVCIICSLCLLGLFCLVVADLVVTFVVEWCGFSCLCCMVDDLVVLGGCLFVGIVFVCCWLLIVYCFVCELGFGLRIYTLLAYLVVIVVFVVCFGCLFLLRFCIYWFVLFSWRFWCWYKAGINGLYCKCILQSCWAWC